MPYPILAVVTGFAASAVWLTVVMALDVYWQQQEPEVVHCPTAKAPAAVHLTTANDSPQVLRCSRWPLHQGCTQACLEGADSLKQRA